MLADSGTGVTREMPGGYAGSDGGDTAEFALGGIEGSESPTIEQPAPRKSDMRAKLDAALRQNAPASDATAELALDDLGLDLGDMEHLEGVGAGGGVGDLAEDAPTMLASFDNDAQRLIEEAESRRGRPSDDTAATMALDAIKLGSDDDVPAIDTGSTSLVAKLDLSGLDDAFDLTPQDQPAAAAPAAPAAKSDATHDFPLDLDIGQPTMPDVGATARVPSLASLPEAAESIEMADAAGDDQDLTLPSLEPITISEVGTKLDLARAYMDMGDPDGARNILREVLQEGSMSQKQEAQRLIETLPG
jgi:pilus assembly protein FimV